MVFNATLNNISVISWKSVLLVEETGVPGENHRSVASHWQTWSDNVVSSTPRLSGVQTHNVNVKKYVCLRSPDPPYFSAADPNLFYRQLFHPNFC
jgi:hypothetical protein